MKGQTFTYRSSGIARVTVDPNFYVSSDPAATVAMFEEASRIPHIGEWVLATQPDEDSSPDYVGRARVTAIDMEHELIYLWVDWNSFALEGNGHSPFGDAASVASRSSSTSSYGGIRLRRPTFASGRTRTHIKMSAA